MNSALNHGGKMLRYDKYQKYICFDFETCNLNLLDLNNKPWQLSYVIAHGNDIVKEVDNYIYWPDLKMSEDAKIITHFDERRYKSLARDPKPILEDFEEIIFDKGYLIVGQNLLGFDVYIHNIYRKLLGKNTDFSFVERIIDTNCIAKAIKKKLQPPKNTDLIYWQYKLNDFREKGLKTSIKSQLKEYDIEFDEDKLHNSMYDVSKNFEIFKKQIWRIDI
jgi:DNA polymerase III epsilon subunit-like protein